MQLVLRAALLAAAAQQAAASAGCAVQLALLEQHASAFQATRDTGALAQAMRTCVEDCPTAAGCWYNLGVAIILSEGALGSPVDALHSTQRASKLDSTYAFREAFLLNELGRHQEAETLGSSACEPVPGSACSNDMRVEWAVAGLHSGADPASVLERLEGVDWSASFFETNQAVRGRFCLAMALRRLGRHEKALEELNAVNAVNSENVAQLHGFASADAVWDNLQLIHGAVVKAFTAPALVKAVREAVDHATPAGPGTISPVFVVGLPRSGTTLLEELLVAHSPAVAGAGETEHLQAGTNPLDCQQHPNGTIHNCRIMGDLVEERQSRAAAYLEATLDLAARRAPGSLANATLLIDKLPLNWMFLPYARLLFPHAKVLRCVRDWHDTAASNLFQPFTDFTAAATSRDLASFKAFSALYESTLALWERELGAFWLDVQYEDLVSRPRETLQAVYAHLGLSPESAHALDVGVPVLSPGRFVYTASALQVSQPLYQSSIGYGRAYTGGEEPYVPPATS